MQPKTLKLALAVLLVVCLAFVVSGCRKKGQSAELGLKPGKVNAATGSPSGPGSGTSTAEEPKSPSSPGATSTGRSSSGSGSGNSGTSGGSSGGSGSNSSGSGSGTSGGSGGSGTKPTPAKGLVVKVLWWNDTKTKAPNGCEIIFGSSSFKPVVAKEAASGSIGPVPYGKTAQLVVYPDGRSGKKIVVPFVVDTAMIANSDRDAIHVQISDTDVRVLGNAVDGFDKTFDRF